MVEVTDKAVQKKIEQLLDDNLYEDVRNANLAPEDGRRAPSGAPQDLLEEWVRGLRMDCEANGEDDEEDSTSFSDMSTQTEWTAGWEPSPERQSKTDKGSGKRSSELMDNIYDIPHTRLTKEEVQILESRLNWLGSQIHGPRAQYQCALGNRRSVTMPSSRTSSKRSTVRSMTARSDDIALAEFRRELAKVSAMSREREERHLRRKQQHLRDYHGGEKVLNDLDAPHQDILEHCSDNTSDNNPSFHEEEEEVRPSRGAQMPEPSSKRSSGTCSCSNSSCSCSCCSDAWWQNQDEPVSAVAAPISKGALSTVEETDGDQVPQGARPEPEGEEMKMDDSSTSSVSSGYLDGWREEGRRKERAMTMTSTTTSSSAGGPTTGWSSYRPESDEWVFVVSSSLSSAPDQEVWLAKEGVGVVRGKVETIMEEDLKREERKDDSLGYGTLPPSESDLLLRAAEQAKQNEKNLKNNNKEEDKDKKKEKKTKEKKRGLAYFRKKISEKDKKSDSKEIPPSPAPKEVPPPVQPAGKGKVMAEVARINDNSSREVALEPAPLARLRNENRPRMTSAIIRERTSSLGRSFGRRPPLRKFEAGVLPDRASLTSPEVTPKRSARKAQLMRERAMQIEVERSQMTTDDEDDEVMNLDLDESWMAKAKGQMRRRRRSRTFSGERRRMTGTQFAPQAPGIGQLLMVQAEYGQKSLTRDNIHITAV